MWPDDSDSETDADAVKPFAVEPFAYDAPAFEREERGEEVQLATDAGRYRDTASGRFVDTDDVRATRRESDDLFETIDFSIDW